MHFTALHDHFILFVLIYIIILNNTVCLYKFNVILFIYSTIIYF